MSPESKDATYERHGIYYGDKHRVNKQTRSLQLNHHHGAFESTGGNGDTGT